MTKKKMTDVCRRDCCRMALRRRHAWMLLTWSRSFSGDITACADSGCMVRFRLGLLVHGHSFYRRHDSPSALFRKEKGQSPVCTSYILGCSVFDVSTAAALLCDQRGRLSLALRCSP